MLLYQEQEDNVERDQQLTIASYKYAVCAARRAAPPLYCMSRGGRRGQCDLNIGAGISGIDITQISTPKLMW